MELILPSTLLVALRSSLPGNTNWFQATLTGFDRCHGSVMLGHCIENISSILVQQSLICEGRELMASTSLENSDSGNDTWPGKRQ